MKKIVFVLALILSATPGLARVGPQWPALIEEAPIDRAIANVTANRDLTTAQRERLLGRLHLIGYAQGNIRLKHYADGQWTLPNQPPSLCRDYGQFGGFFCLGGPPDRELPETVGSSGAEAQAHLRLARDHYDRAVAIDGGVLRARLGLAYVLDELNLDDDARAQLREIIAIGSPRVQGPYSNAEDHAILSETVDHLSDLAQSDSDRRLVTQLRARLGVNRPSYAITPIVIPLIDAPFAKLIDTDSQTAFDFGGIGVQSARGWLSRDAAWLVWDPNQRGEIRTGFDLIGQRSWGVFWSDGFEALRALDDDGDGELTGAELDGLALWRDADGDGVSEAGEVQPLSAYGVISLSTRGADERPGLIVAPAGVRLKSGESRPLYDWTPGFEAASGS